MKYLGRIEVFIEVAKQQSFAKAARILGVTGPAASKQVFGLEAELGVKLLNRTTRHVSLTEEGTVYFERVRIAIDELSEAAIQIQDLKAKPQGSIKISAPLSFGHMHLLPVFAGFAKKYPDIQMDVMLDDRKVDVVEEGYDVAIRIGTMVESNLIGKHLADCPLLLVASPEYLRKHGAPELPSDLTKHRMIAYSLQSGATEWRYRAKAGKTGVIRFGAVFKANTAEMMLQATLDGVGISVLPIFSVETFLKAGRLTKVLPGFETDPARTIFALMPPNRYRSAKVKLFVAWLYQACEAMPWDIRQTD